MASPRVQRRLVVLTYHFPLDGSVGGLRWAGLTKYLSTLGWTSTVVTAAPPHQGPETSGATTISLSRRRTATDLYRWLARAEARDQSAGTGTPSAVARRDGLWKRSRREVDTLLWFPDESRGWIMRSARRLRRAIRATDPHVVVSSGPPHGAHMAAWLATRGLDVAWFADLRDPWAFLVWPGHPQVESRLASAAARWCERLVAARCTGMIANTPELVEALTARYPHTKVFRIPNGVDRELLPRPDATPFPGFALAHVGSLYGRRDITPVLQAVGALCTHRVEARAEGCTLHLVGDIDRPQRELLGRVAEDLTLPGAVKLYGVVPRTEALGVLARSHVAVIAAQGQDMNEYRPSFMRPSLSREPCWSWPPAPVRPGWRPLAWAPAWSIRTTRPALPGRWRISGPTGTSRPDSRALASDTTRWLIGLTRCCGLPAPLGTRAAGRDAQKLQGQRRF